MKGEAMSELRRYSEAPSNSPYLVEEDPDGEFVMFDDHLDEVSALQRKLDVAVSCLQFIAGTAEGLVEAERPTVSAVKLAEECNTALREIGENDESSK